MPLLWIGDYVMTNIQPDDIYDEDFALCVEFIRPKFDAISDCQPDMSQMVVQTILAYACFISKGWVSIENAIF